MKESEKKVPQTRKISPSPFDSNPPKKKKLKNDKEKMFIEAYKIIKNNYEIILSI